MERKLATIRKIEEIKKIPDADKICAYRVGGWWVVDSVDKYKIDDLVVYCEVDSWIPTELAPFLSKGKEPREYNGVKGERLRTVKLRGQLSQGLLLPATVIGDYAVNYFNESDRWAIGLIDENEDRFSEFIFEGDDVTERLGIQKWEMEVPARLAGQVKGNFPTAIPKTDQERVQNLVKEIAGANGAIFEVTEKLEGSSMTCYLIDGVFGVCSRNLDLKRDENNAFWRTAIKYDIESKMREYGRDFAIQGELIGPGVQGNIYGLSDLEFHVFDAYDIQQGVYMTPYQRHEMIAEMKLNHVPFIQTLLLQHDVDSLLKYAEGKSVLNPKQEREGVVFKEINGGMTFKAISNRYLIKQG